MTEVLTKSRPRIDDPQELDRVVKLLVEDLDPLAIYLFGSRARGDARVDSDYDVMVVVPDETFSEKKRRTVTHEKVGRLYANVFLSRESSFAWRRHEVGTLQYEVAVDGVRLYPEIAGDLDLSKRKIPAGRRRSLEVIREWLGRVERDLGTARLCCEADDPIPDQGAYHVQQAAEKLTKAALIAHDKRPRKGHQIGEFAKQLPKDCSDRERYLALARFSDYAWAHRYPWEGEGDPIPEPSAEEVLDWIEEVEALKADFERWLGQAASGAKRG